MRMRSVSFILAMVFALLGSTLYSQEKKEEAKPAAKPGPSGASTFAIDPVHSSVLFRVSHVNTAYYYGRFTEVSGTVVWDEKNPEASSVEAEVKTESVNTQNAKRDQHLKSPDFFSAKEFPAITFKSTKIKSLGAGKYSLEGDFSLHGVTRQISLVFEKTGESTTPMMGHRIGGEAIAEIKRSDYGMTFLPDAVGNDIRLILSLEAVQK